MKAHVKRWVICTAIFLVLYVLSHYLVNAMVYFKMISKDSFLFKIFDIIYYPLDRLDMWYRHYNSPPPGWQPK